MKQYWVFEWSRDQVAWLGRWAADLANWEERNWLLCWHFCASGTTLKRWSHDFFVWNFFLLSLHILFLYVPGTCSKTWNRVTKMIVECKNMHTSPISSNQIPSKRFKCRELSQAFSSFLKLAPAAVGSCIQSPLNLKTISEFPVLLISTSVQVRYTSPF